MPQRARRTSYRTYENPRPSIWYVVVRTFRRLIQMQVWDIAGTMTFYGLLSILPGLISVVSMVSMIGVADETLETIGELMHELWPVIDPDVVTHTLLRLTQAPGGTLAFVLGVIGSIYSASNVIAAFHRAMHRIFDTREGRPFILFRTVVFIETILLMIAVLAILAVVILGADFSRHMGTFLGIPSEAFLVWNAVKWPLVLITVIIIVSVSYYRGPNVIIPKFRLLTGGGVFTVLVLFGLIVVTGWLVDNVAVLSEVLYTLNGIIYLVVLIWIGFIVLLTGAVWDAEHLRARQLATGYPAWDEVQLRPRQTWVLEQLDYDQQKSMFIGRVVHRSVRTHDPVTTVKTPQLTEKGKLFAVRASSNKVSTGTPFKAQLSEQDFVLDDHRTDASSAGVTVHPPQRPAGMSERLPRLGGRDQGQNEKQETDNLTKPLPPETGKHAAKHSED